MDAGRTNSPRLARRLFTSISRIAGYFVLFVLFVASLAFGAVLHLDLPVTRRAGADILEQFLQRTFQGSFEIGSFVRLERGGVTVEEFVVLEPTGKKVLSIDEVSVDVDVLDILDRVFSGYEKISIEIERVRIRGSEVFIEPTSRVDAEGKSLGYPGIADAFEPREDEEPPASEPRGRPVRVWFPRIGLQQVFARINTGDLTLESRVQSASARLLVTDKGVSVDIARFRLAATGLAGADAEAHGEVHVRAPGATWGTVAGRVGELPFEQEFRIEGDSIEVKGRFPEVRPSAARPLVAAWPLDRTISLSNHLRGSGSEFTVVADVRQATDELTPLPPARVTGTFSVSPNFRADLTAVTHALDLSNFLSTLPPSRLDSETRIDITTRDDVPYIAVESEVQPGTIAGQPTPHVSAVATWSESAWAADAELTETGMNIQVKAQQKVDAPIAVHANIAKLDLTENERSRSYLPGARGELQGTVNAEIREKDAQVDATLSFGGVAYGGTTVNSGSLQASSLIPFDAPKSAEAEVDVKLGKASAGILKLENATITSRGPILKPRLEAKARTERQLDLQIATDADFSTTTFRQIKAQLSGDGKPIEVEAKRASFANERIVVEDFRLESIGKIYGDVDIGNRDGSVHLTAEGLSISRIFGALGMARNELAGDLDAKIDLELGARPEGTVVVGLRNGAFQGVDGMHLTVNAKIDDRDTTGTIQGEVRDLGKLESSWEARLGGHMLEERSYRMATGRLSASAETADLRHLSALFGKAIGAKTLTGAITVGLDVDRSDATTSPSVELSLRTQEFGGRFEGDEGETIITGVDLSAGFFTRAGEDRIEAALRVDDSRGTFVSTSGTIDFPVRDFWSGRDDIDLTQAALSAPLNLVVLLPKRNLNRWPSFVPRPLDRGSLSARLAVTGTILAPQVGLVVSGRRLDGDESPFSGPLDVDFNGRYDATTGNLRGSTQLMTDGARVGSIEMDVIAPARYLKDPPPKQVPYFTGQAKVQLDSTRLDALRTLKERRVQGLVQGSVIIERRGWVPNVRAQVNLRDLGFGENLLGDALMEVTTTERELIARAQFDDDYGSLNARVEMGFEPNPYFLHISEERSVFATVEADQYDAAVLSPVLSEVFDELSGSLHGKLRAVWTPPAADEDEWSTELSGNMKMTDGVLTPSALGLRLEDARFSMTASREANLNVVRINSFGARAESKKHNLHAEAVLYLRNLDLVRGSFSLRPDKVPVKNDGADVATVSGEVRGRFEMKETDLRVLVDIDDLTATLPQVADNNLFVLEENPNIQILQHQTAKEKNEEEEDPLIVAIKVNLGNYVRVESDLINLRVRGSPEITLGKELEMRGAVEMVPGGRLDVMGRRFTVERGTVQFGTGDPTNPQVSASASWKAPNGVLVRANVEGTAQNPILSWSSEPALSGGEAEIISLVLGGGNSGSSGSTGLSTAFAAANQALGQAGADWVRVSTTQEASSGEARMGSLNDNTTDSYSVAFRIDDDLWFETNFEQSGSGVAQQRTSTVNGILDWRFHPQWSLRTTLGTGGAGLDMVWQYRY